MTTDTKMNEKKLRLLSLLREMFQLDQPDLDFGLYRIMHAKRAEVETFLETEFDQLIDKVFASRGARHEEEAKREYERLHDEVVADGGNPETSKKVEQARARYDFVRLSGGEDAEIYDHLYRFFSRYYDQGDFMSLRRYGKGAAGGAETYAVAYDGSEVVLHWANKDQYYIKTTENFSEFSFDPRKALRKDENGVNRQLFDNLGGQALKVHFRIVAATESSHNNVKASDQGDRYFILDEAAPIAWEGTELVVRITYRPDLERTGQKGKWQEKRNNQLVQKVLATLAGVEGDGKALAQEYHIALSREVPKGKDQSQPLLSRYIGQYTASNTMDYFIHKDLGAFLRRELDFYLKNEVLKLDDFVGGEDGDVRGGLNEAKMKAMQNALERAQAIRLLSQRLIDFLAQLEDFQKKLWLKRKFVVATHYCITTDRIPEEFHAEIAANDRQRAEWQDVLSGDGSIEISLGSALSSEAVLGLLRGGKTLTIDTAHFDDRFAERLLDRIDLLDDQVCGTLIHGDNFHAMRLASEKYSESIQSVYLDPPFNTGADSFHYKDSFPHSSWLTMMHSRLASLRRLIRDDGSLFVHIDYTEKERLRLMLDQLFVYQTEIIWRIGWLSGYKTVAQKFIRNHDTIYQYSKSDEFLFNKLYIPYPEGYVRRDGKAPEGKGYPLEDTWNCSELDSLNSIQIVSFSKEKVGNQSLTQKNEALVDRIFSSTSNPGDLVADFFLGSGTSAAVAFKSGRRFICSEMGGQFYDYSLPRMKRVLAGDRYGVSERYDFPSSGVVKYITLESYEDCLNNLSLNSTGGAVLREGDAHLRRDYLLRYMLDVETRGSACLQNVALFRDPEGYQMEIKEFGSDERVKRNVDLVETFNWLIGLHVERLHAGRRFGATFIREPDPLAPAEANTRLQAVTITESEGGDWWFRPVEGYLQNRPGGGQHRQTVLVLWRTLTDDPEKDAAVLEAYLARQMKFDPSRREDRALYDIIYVNGTHNLPSLGKYGEIRLLEEEFHRRMWAGEDA